jgi:hypothetical protein
MSWASAAIERLQKGEQVTIRPRGTSMEPKVHDGQAVTLQPATAADVQVGDIVLCRVHGCDYLHLVKAVAPPQVLIGNNRGRINGWTSKVFGKVILT